MTQPPVNRPAGGFGHYLAPGVLLVIVIATAALFLVRAIGPDQTDFEEDDRAGEPEVHMETAALRQFDAAGQLEYSLVAPDIRFFRAQGRAELNHPDLTLYRGDRGTWQVQADRGTLHGSSVGGSGEDEVRLQDGVLLQPLSGPRRARLTTESLTLYPERQFAATDQAVIIDGEGGRTAAAGLEGDLQGGLLKLFSSAERPVQTILLPGQFK
jgi:lipopolysaccharide export system protein LptC